MKVVLFVLVILLCVGGILEVRDLNGRIAAQDGKIAELTAKDEALEAGMLAGFKAAQTNDETLQANIDILFKNDETLVSNDKKLAAVIDSAGTNSGASAGIDMTKLELILKLASLLQ